MEAGKKKGLERKSKRNSKVSVVLGRENLEKLKGSLMHVDGVLLGVASFPFFYIWL